jgi:hypothetical protein
VHQIQHIAVIDQKIRRKEIRLPFQTAADIINIKILHGGSAFQLGLMQNEMTSFMARNNTLFFLWLLLINHYIPGLVHDRAVPTETIPGISIAGYHNDTHVIQQFERI